MKKIYSSLLISAMLLGVVIARAQHVAGPSAQGGITALNAPAGYWRSVPLAQAPTAALIRNKPQQYLVYSLNEALLKPQLFLLSEAGDEQTVISLPMPDGSMRSFKVWQTPMMAAELAAQYPEIKTFSGEAVNDSRVTIKLDFTVYGFHAIVFESGNTSFIDPYDNLHDGYYMVHYKRHELRTMAQRMKCEVKADGENGPGSGELMETMQRQLPKLDLKKTNFTGGHAAAARTTAGTAARTANGWMLRTYRLAVAANHEYCQAVTGSSTPTIAACLSAMTTTVNRVNGVYNREFSVQMNFVAGETSLIFPVATGDPFDGLNTDPSGCLSQNQVTCDGIIGSSGYDIGHVFTTGAGGLAYVGIVCNSSFKAQGVTGSSSPTGDGYDIDYVAHEMGHEFGSSHTFNNNINGSCTGNASATHAYEPGSGATIMDYAGICSPDDLQPHSDPYFSNSSVLQICAALVSSETCGVNTATGNDTAHITSFNAFYNIPYKTPFELTGPTAILTAPDTATTYCWYQWNLPTGTDLGARLNQTFVTGPIFRSFQPAYTPYRMFPKLSLVLSGTLSDAGVEGNEGEKAPDTARYLTFKMNVRTILNGKGCVNVTDDTTHINAVATGAANAYQGFKVTSQASVVTYTGGSAQTVTWNVVGTNVAPVSATSVDIYMSTDGALTWTMLGTYPNTGSASVTLLNPATTSTATRIKVKGSGNVFFNINGANFTVTHFTAPVVGPINGTFAICSGSSTILTDTSLGGTWSSSNTAVGTIGAVTGVFTGIAAGTTTITYTAPAGIVTQVVTVNAAPVAGAITGPGTVCVAQSITLADASGTAGGVWSSSSVAVASVGTSGIVTGNAAGTTNISYTVTNSCGSASAVKAITVNPLPVVAPITGPSSICGGLTTTLFDATPSGVFSSPGAGSVAYVDASGFLSAGSAGTITISYTVTNASGCQSAATLSFTVLPVPIATTSPSGPVTICTGSDLLITASPGSGAYTYQWQQGGMALPGATNATYTASTAGDYLVLITSAAGCTGASATVNVSISSSAVVVPAVSISATPGLVICGGATAVTYTAVPVNGGSAPTYQWTVNGMLMASGGTFTYTPANGDIIGCTLTSNAPCASPVTATTSVTMTVVAPVTPTVAVSVAPDDTVCVGSPVTYTAVSTFAGTMPAYSWSVNGVTTAAGSSFTTTPADGDVVIVTLISNYTPCLATPTVSSAPFVMHVLPAGANTVAISASSSSIVAGESITFVAIAPNAGSSPAYQWFIGFDAVAGATNATFTVATLTNGQVVYCKVTSSNPCITPHIALSGGFAVMVTTGVWQVTGSGSSFVLTPNPNNGSFSIIGRLGAAADGKVAIVVSNVLGQAIYKETAMATHGDLAAHISLSSSLPNGTYFVNVISGADNIVFHLVIDK